MLEPPAFLGLSQQRQGLLSEAAGVSGVLASCRYEVYGEAPDSLLENKGAPTYSLVVRTNSVTSSVRVNPTGTKAPAARQKTHSS